jgi:hypothetical protein
MSDAGIPLLTEIISLPALPVPEPAPLAHPPPYPATPMSAAGAASLQQDEWDALEEEVRERVLRQVMQQIDSVLEQCVRDSLADVLQTAVEGLAADIRSGLNETLRGVVDCAVRQEIGSTKSSRNQP